MTKDEMRFLRRELINMYIHLAYMVDASVILSAIKWDVRYKERVNYGQELKAYGA